jgi:hypothetical protein
VPLAPGRLTDTREPFSPTLNPFTRTGSNPIDVVTVPVAGRFSLPATGVGAVVLTVTGLSSGNPNGGWINAIAGDATRPLTSSLNTNGGNDIRPNLVIVPLGPNGDIDLHLLDVGHAVVDITGYFTNGSAAVSTSGRFRSITPYREVDTRTPVGLGPSLGSATYGFNPPVVPDNALALSQNITLVHNLTPGFFTAYPTEPRPFVSTANLDGGNQIRAAAAFTPMASGEVRYFSQPITHFVIDVTGYFEP